MIQTIKKDKKIIGFVYKKENNTFWYVYGEPTQKYWFSFKCNSYKHGKEIIKLQLNLKTT